MKSTKVKSVIAALAVVLAFTFIGGCAALQGMSKEQQYLAARIEFNTMEKQYLDYYDAATPEQQADYKVRIDPIFAKAEIALDAWGMTVKGGGTVTGDQQKFLDLKNQLIDALAEIYGRK